MDAFITAARHELERLETELRSDPRHEKIKCLRELLTMYHPPVTARPPKRRRSAISDHFVAKPTAGSPSKTKAMETAISALLTARVQVHRSNILQHLIEAKIMGGEKRPMLHLASFLSDRRHIYESDGKGNFRFRATEPAVSLALESDKEAAA